MSHYNSYSKSSLKKYTNDPPTYLSKKRQDHDIDLSSKKRYDYEDKYDRYEKYDKYDKYEKYSGHQCKYPLIKDYSQNYYNHSSNQNKYRNRDGWYYNNKYHYQSNKSPRKKTYQRYSNDSEGVRNLSHCDMPSPTKEENNGLLQGFNTIVSSFVSSQSGYQHSFQNPQNININLISQQQVNLNSGNSRKRRYGSMTEPEKENKRDKDFKDSSSNDYNKNCPFPRPEPKVELIPFNKSSITIPNNPFDELEPIPQCDYTPLPSFPLKNNLFGNDLHSKSEDGQKNNSVSLNSCYLLAKMHNWNLVTNFVPAAQLLEEKYDNIPIIDDKGVKKSYVVYSEEFESQVDKLTEVNSTQKKKIKNEILNVMQNLEHFSCDIRKIKDKIYNQDWKIKSYSIKIDAINNAIRENTKET